MKLLKSFGFAIRGIGHAAKTQMNLKIHFAAAIVVLAAGFYFSITTGEWIAILILMGMVVSLELMNTAIEQVVDLISPDQNENAGRIKDISAGAVLVVSIVSVIIAFVIFWKHISA
jgi:diacylglycerol kinase